MIEKWECEVSVEDFQRTLEFGLESKVPQLAPKDAFYGGRTDSFCGPL